MNQNEQENSQTNQHSPQKNSCFLLKTIAYSAAAVSAAAVIAPFALAGYAYVRTAELTGRATKWAFDNPIKTLAGVTAGVGLYYAANNINWEGIEEKLSQNTTQIAQEYQELRLANMNHQYLKKTGQLEETIATLNDHTKQLEQQNNLLRRGGSVIYEQYDPKLLVGIGVGSAAIGGLIGGIAGYSSRKKDKKTQTTNRSRIKQL